MKMFPKVFFVSIVSSALFVLPTISTASTASAAGHSQTVKTVTVSASATAPAPVNINSATAKTLLAVPGMTPARAKSIVAFRRKNGPFASLAELRHVPGFKRMNEQVFANITQGLSPG